MGCVLPEQGYLKGLRDLCTKHNMLLIFDEVMTGFRLAPGGAQQLYNITPDLTTLGKIIGGGLPVGAYGGKREIMNAVSPAGPIYQAGTLSGNPMAMAAGLAILKELKNHPVVYQDLQNCAAFLVKELKVQMARRSLTYTINQVGSMFTLFFTDKRVVDYDTAKTCDTVMFGKYFNAMLRRGVYMAPSQFESLFLSHAINEDVCARILEASNEAFDEIIS